MTLPVSLWLVGFIILLTYAQRLHEELTTETSWIILWAGGALVTLGLLSPSFWAGLFFIWVGLQIPWTQIAFRKLGTDHIVPLVPLVERQGILCLTAATYVILARSHVNVLPYAAPAIIAWMVFNTVAATYEKYSSEALPGRVILEPGWPPSAYVGSSHMLAWLAGLSFLSIAYLAHTSLWWLLAAPPVAFGAWLTRNLTGWASGLIATALGLSVLHPDWAPFVVGMLLLGSILFRKRFTGSRQFQNRFKVWAIVWKRYLRWTGRGLGFIQSASVEIDYDDYHVFKYENLHNEWLQGLIELGPLAPLCAIGFLAAHLGWATPLDAYASGILIQIALQGVFYFPMHLPGQAFTMLLAMAARS